MVDKAAENPHLTNLSEALEFLNSTIPQDLRDRRFCGDNWEQIFALGDILLDQVIPTRNGNLKVKMFLAANLINSALQNWLSEAAMKKKAYPGGKLVKMDKKEADFIVRTLTPQLVNFVKNDLGVNIILHPSHGQPHVPIVEEDLPEHEVTDEALDVFISKHPLNISIVSDLYVAEVYMGSQREIAKKIIEFMNENGLVVTPTKPEIVLLVNAPIKTDKPEIQDIGGTKYAKCTATILFFTTTTIGRFENKILVPADFVKMGKPGEA